MDFPVLFTRKEECCGCTACYAICPVNAISMKPDEEGFDYPVVDQQKCIKCHKCVKICPLKNKKINPCGVHFKWF